MKNLDKHVSTIMTTELITVREDTPYAKLKTLCGRRGIHHILVENKDKELLGIISTEDLLRSKRFSIFEDKMTAEYIMTGSPTNLQYNASIREAIVLFLDNQFRALPIINQEDQLIGIVTPFDIMHMLLENE